MYIKLATVLNSKTYNFFRISGIFFGDMNRVQLDCFETEEFVNPHVMAYGMPNINMGADDPNTAVYKWLVGQYGPLMGGELIFGEREVLALRNTALNKINTRRDKSINGGCVTDKGIFDTDEVSIRNILGTCQIASISVMLNKPFEINWRLADNSFKKLTANEIIAVSGQIMQHVSDCYKISWDLKAEIEAATTHAEIAAVDLYAKWTALTSIPESNQETAPTTVTEENPLPPSPETTTP